MVRVVIDGVGHYVDSDAVHMEPPIVGSPAARLTDALVKRHGWVTADSVDTTEDEKYRLEDIARKERGEVGVLPPRRDPSDPTWQNYCREALEYRQAILSGREAGAAPVPPPAPEVDRAALHAQLRREARQERVRFALVGKEARGNTRGSIARQRGAGRPAGRPRAAATRSSGDSGEDSSDSSDPPAARPRGSAGPEQLLKRLVERGLDRDAIERAAGLVLVLDEDATANREAVAA